MPRLERLYEKLRASPANCSLNELLGLLRGVGFVEKRRKGSHVIYGHPDHPGAFINIQRRGNEAKPYQVEQVLNVIDELNLMED